jgi:enterochelin esterase-like enzyme
MRVKESIPGSRRCGWHLRLWIITVLVAAVSACATAPPADRPAVLIDPTSTSPEPDAATPTPPPIPTFTLTASPTITPGPVCSETTGELEHLQLDDSPLAPEPLRFIVYTPPCYQAETDRYYPVLYLIHGQLSTEEQWVHLGVPARMDALTAAGEIPPFLVVMPFDKSSALPDNDPFGLAVINDLIPWIDAHYRTLAIRPYRAIGGLSRGAGWAVHLGLEYWELFGAIGGHSLAVQYGDEARVSGWLDAIPAGSYPRIYLDIGASDGLFSSAAQIEQLLDARGIPHEWHPFQGYHNEAYWSSHVDDYLRWYGEGW